MGLCLGVPQTIPSQETRPLIITVGFMLATLMATHSQEIPFKTIMFMGFPSAPEVTLIESIIITLAIKA